MDTLWWKSFVLSAAGRFILWLLKWVGILCCLTFFGAVVGIPLLILRRAIIGLRNAAVEAERQRLQHRVGFYFPPQPLD